MLIVCPNCKKRFDIGAVSAADDKKLRCSSCRAVFRLVRKTPAPASVEAQAVTGLPASIPAVAAAAFPPSQFRTLAPAGAPVAGRIRVVVANESLPFCEAVGKVLADEPFDLVICTDGKKALDTVEQIRPELLLLDVALPAMFGFEVCERIRQNPELNGVKIVLIASIYDKTRYKRSPISLYGADDYLEKHHIPDSLVPMIHRLVSGLAPAPSAPSPVELVLQERSRTEIRWAEVSQTQGEPQQLGTLPAELSGDTRKARRLARIIVSDISLYSQAKVEKGVREGTFYELLSDDIREGELLYRQRVSEAVRQNSSYLTDAFEELIAKKRAELHL